MTDIFDMCSPRKAQREYDHDANQRNKSQQSQALREKFKAARAENKKKDETIRNLEEQNRRKETELGELRRRVHDLELENVRLRANPATNSTSAANIATPPRPPMPEYTGMNTGSPNFAGRYEMKATMAHYQRLMSLFGPVKGDMEEIIGAPPARNWKTDFITAMEDGFKGGEALHRDAPWVGEPMKDQVGNALNWSSFPHVHSHEAYSQAQVKNGNRKRRQDAGLTKEECEVMESALSASISAAMADLMDYILRIRGSYAGLMHKAMDTFISMANKQHSGDEQAAREREYLCRTILPREGPQTTEWVQYCESLNIYEGETHCAPCCYAHLYGLNTGLADRDEKWFSLLKSDADNFRGLTSFAPLILRPAFGSALRPREREFAENFFFRADIKDGKNHFIPYDERPTIQPGLEDIHLDHKEDFSVEEGSYQMSWTKTMESGGARVLLNCNTYYSINAVSINIPTDGRLGGKSGILVGKNMGVAFDLAMQLNGVHVEGKPRYDSSGRLPEGTKFDVLVHETGMVEENLDGSYLTLKFQKITESNRQINAPSRYGDENGPYRQGAAGRPNAMATVCHVPDALDGRNRGRDSPLIDYMKCSRTSYEASKMAFFTTLADLGGYLVMMDRDFHKPPDQRATYVTQLDQSQMRPRTFGQFCDNNPAKSAEKVSDWGNWLPARANGKYWYNKEPDKPDTHLEVSVDLDAIVCFVMGPREVNAHTYHSAVHIGGGQYVLPPCTSMEVLSVKPPPFEYLPGKFVWRKLITVRPTYNKTADLAGWVSSFSPDGVNVNPEFGAMINELESSRIPREFTEKIKNDMKTTLERHAIQARRKQYLQRHMPKDLSVTSANVNSALTTGKLSLGIGYETGVPISPEQQSSRKQPYEAIEYNQGSGREREDGREGEDAYTYTSPGASQADPVGDSYFRSQEKTHSNYAGN